MRRSTVEHAPTAKAVKRRNPHSPLLVNDANFTILKQYRKRGGLAEVAEDGDFVKPGSQELLHEVCVAQPHESRDVSGRPSPFAAFRA
jgi:hypothetical protein